MRNALAVARREINAAFLSLLAWTVLTIFLIFSGFFFWLFASRTHEASLEGTVGIISFFFLVAMPLLTMRLLSEEYRSGTIETLMTAPVTEFQVILGKFIGALAFYGFMLAPTLAYAVILLRPGQAGCRRDVLLVPGAGRDGLRVHRAGPFLQHAHPQPDRRRRLRARGAAGPVGHRRGRRLPARAAPELRRISRHDAAPQRFLEPAASRSGTCFTLPA